MDYHLLKPFRVPSRVETLPIDICLVGCVSELDLSEGICGVRGSVHDRQVPARHHLHSDFARHLDKL